MDRTHKQYRNTERNNTLEVSNTSQLTLVGTAYLPTGSGLKHRQAVHNTLLLHLGETQWITLQ